METMTEDEKQFLEGISGRAGSVRVAIGGGKTVTLTDAEWEKLKDLALKYRVTVRSLLAPSRQ